MPGQDEAARRRLSAALGKPFRTIAEAQQALNDCKAVCASDINLAERGAKHVYQFLRGVATTNAIHEKFRGRGANLTVAEGTCSLALANVGMVMEFCSTGTASRPHVWDKSIASVESAAEYLRILNNETAAGSSQLVADVHEVSNVTLKCVAAGTALVIAVPLVVTFVAEAGVVGVVAHAGRVAASRVLTFCITNPVAAIELTEFAVSTTISIGQAGGPVEWAKGLATPEGALATGLDIIVIYVALHGGGPMPPPRGSRRAPPHAPHAPPTPPGGGGAAPPPRYRRVQARVTKRDAKGIEARIIQVDDVADLPPSTPPKVRAKVQEEQAKTPTPRRERLAAQMAQARAMAERLPDGFPIDRARQAVKRARSHPGSRAHPGSIDETHGGVCECNGVSNRMKVEFEDGDVIPAGVGGDHDVYRWPKNPKMGEPYVIIDASAAQFTEFVKGTPAAKGKNLIPVERLRQANLLQCVIDGIFTPGQHRRFCELVKRAF